MPGAGHEGAELRLRALTPSGICEEDCASSDPMFIDSAPSWSDSRVSLGASSAARLRMPQEHPVMRALAVLLALVAAVPAAAQIAPSDTSRIYELTEVEVL